MNHARTTNKKQIAIDILIIQSDILKNATNNTPTITTEVIATPINLSGTPNQSLSTLFIFLGTACELILS